MKTLKELQELKGSKERLTTRLTKEKELYEINKCDSMYHKSVLKEDKAYINMLEEIILGWQEELIGKLYQLRGGCD